jgi:hypothetical protein
MTTFTIDPDNHITAHATAEAAAATTRTPFDTFSSQAEFAELAQSWPVKRLVAIWSGLPGAAPVHKFQDRKAATRRIWQRMQELAAPVPAPPAPASAPKAERPAKRSAQRAKAAPAKGQAARKATAVNHAPRAKQAAQPPEISVAGRGSKKAEVIAMLRRKNGVTLSEITRLMGWQKHTVRGFMAGAMKKAGLTVESFKPAGGERTYRLK